MNVMSCMSQNCQDNERLALENEELAVAYNNTLKEIAILKKYREKAKENEYNKQALINQERSADREIERLRKRVQELVEENERLCALNIATTHELNHVDKINKRYREALEEVITLEEYNNMPNFWHDEGDFYDYLENLARKALENEE